MTAEDVKNLVVEVERQIKECEDAEGRELSVVEKIILTTMLTNVVFAQRMGL